MPTLVSGKIDPVYRFFNAGHGYSQGKEGVSRSNGFHWWQHAEDFIQQLDSAGSVKRQEHLRRLHNHAMDESTGSVVRDRAMPNNYAVRARHIIAAECSLFLQGVSAEDISASEKWMPFVKWGKKLSRQADSNSIITFNYDRVLEMLSGVGGEFEVGLGNGYWDGSGVRVHKLHGSVDWRRDPRTCSLKIEKEFALSGEEDELAIATPGPTKKNLVNAAFRTLWNDALTKLQEAERIIFVGFGFPESDSYVLERLMQAISRAVEPSMEVVLGPDTHSRPIVRLKALLEYQVSRNKGTVKVHPMYGQDFLTVAEY